MFEAGPSWVDSLFELKPGTRWKVGYYEWRTFPGTKDPPPPKEPWESPLERKARRHREKAVGFGIAVLRDRSGELLGILQASFGGRLGMYIKPLLDPITSYYNILFDRWLWKKQQKCIFFLEGSVISWLAEFRVDTQSGLSDSTIHQKNIKSPSDSLIFYFDPRLEWCRLKRCFLLLRFLDVDVLCTRLSLLRSLKKHDGRCENCRWRLTKPLRRRLSKLMTLTRTLDFAVTFLRVWGCQVVSTKQLGRWFP